MTKKSKIKVEEPAKDLECSGIFRNIPEYSKNNNDLKKNLKNKMECEFCNQIFKTKSSLNKHKNTAKYCLSIQKKSFNCKEYKCECNKSFMTEDIFLQHENICLIKKYKNRIKILEEKVSILEKNVIEKDITISNLEGKIVTLQNNQEVIFDIAKQPKNNTNKIINITSEIDFNDIDKIKSIVGNNCTIDYILDGQKGFAKFAVDNLLKDENGNLKYICTDPSRQIFKYKNTEGYLQKDIEAKKLTNYLVDGGISQKVNEISNKWVVDDSGKIDKNKFDVILQKNDEILDLSKNNSVFKKELVAITTIK
jgi:hypothetical protein